MDLPDPEGAVIGQATSIMLLDYLKPFRASISASGENAPMKLNMLGESYPIGSPTILCYVLKYLILRNKEDLKAALAIANFITTIPLCGAPHNGSNAESILMRSPRFAGPADQSC
jgi:hypothetical protein